VAAFVADFCDDDEGDDNVRDGNMPLHLVYLKLVHQVYSLKLRLILLMRIWRIFTSLEMQALVFLLLNSRLRILRMDCTRSILSTTNHNLFVAVLI